MADNLNNENSDLIIHESAKLNRYHGSGAESLYKTDDERKSVFDSALRDHNSPSYQRSLIDSFRGFRAYPNGPAMMPISDNVIGLMFLTRPELNLSDENVYRSPNLYNLIGAGPDNIQGYIRGVLDRKWGDLYQHPMLENKLPFISSLNEYLKVSTGFSDLRLDISTGEPGIRQQVYQSVTSKIEENGQYSMSQTYANPKMGIISGLFQTWLHYISEVVSGDHQVYPYPNYLFANRRDFDCRIYHLIMNKDTEYLESIYATVESIPQTFPAGAMANIDRTGTTARGEGQDDFTVQYSSVGMRFDELTLINAFNQHVYNYNKNLEMDVKGGTNRFYRELHASEYIRFNYNMFPLLLVRMSELKSMNGRTSRRAGIKLTWWGPVKS